MHKHTAESFTAYMKKFPDMYKNLADILHKELFLSKKSVFMLDVGCGPGLIFTYVKELVPNSVLLGIDSSSEMIQIAHRENNQRNPGNVFLSQASSEQLPFKDHSVDAIISRFSLCYWPDPSLAFEEMVRVLKPGGLLILEALNGGFPHWKLQLIKYRMYLKFASNDVITYHIDAYASAYTLDDIKKFLRAAHLQIQRVIGNTSQWKFIVITKKE